MDPATVRKAQWHKEPAQQIYMNRLVRSYKDDTSPLGPDTSEPPTGSYLYPSLRQLAEWTDHLNSGSFNAVSHDLETAGQFIICDGITPLDTRTGLVGRSLCLRFRGHGGHRWWPTWREHLAATIWLGDLLGRADLAFVGHNIVGFDIPILELHGLPVAGPIIDTMVLMNRAHPELQKGLQFTATLFCGAPAWKRMVKEQDDGDGKT